MLRDKITKFLRLPGTASKQQNRNLTVSIEPHSAYPFTQTTRRFSADSKETPVQPDKAMAEDESKAVPVSQERDKVFSEKKMTVMDHIKVGLHHMKKGFIEVGRDTVYLTKLLNKNQFRNESYTVFELRERRRISIDLMKFMPYSVFMIVPFAELALPFYMILFPNSIPTQFMFDSQVGKKTSELVAAQQDSYNKIIPLLPKFANVIGLDPLRFVQSIQDILDKEGKDKDRLFYKVSDFESKIANFVKDYKRMSPAEKDVYSIQHMSAYELEQAAKLLCLDYIPGCNILNNLLWIFTRVPFISFNFFAGLVHKLRVKRNKSLAPFVPFDYKSMAIPRFAFTFNSGPMSSVKKILLESQIKLHLRQIKNQDRQLMKDLDQLEQLPLSHLKSIARQRGISLERASEIRDFLRKFWLPLSVTENLDGDTLVWISFMRYSYTEVLVQSKL